MYCLVNKGPTSVQTDNKKICKHTKILKYLTRNLGHYTLVYLYVIPFFLTVEKRFWEDIFTMSKGIESFVGLAPA
jgi:hypothetical protein